MTKEERKHKCVPPKCCICGETLPLGTDIFDRDHWCYIQPRPPASEHSEKLIFYDFETFTNHAGVHVPFLVCTKTSQRVEWSSYSLKCTQDFLLKYRRPMYGGTTFIAHNSKGFDGYLILNSMMEMGLKPLLLMQDSKFLCLEDPIMV